MNDHPVAVKAILFDVFGTVVDWRGSVIRELTDLGERQGIAADWGAFADRWRAGYHGGMRSVFDRQRRWLKADRMHYERLQKLAPEFGLGSLSAEDLEQLNRVWHRLAPWPGAREGLGRLKQNYTIGTLSNGDTALLVNMARNADLPWDVILGAEDFKSYKPDPAVYLGAVERLGHQPHEVMMAAAHLDDLQHAKECGLRTAFIVRPDEFGDGSAKPDLVAVEPVDVEASDFVDLAAKMGA
ncbi:MAG: haloacid dehalogenase type II [Hyphomicrobiales bacterium]|nr:haloacid dehalogenase type II [Hyphomicrobiales bacterium]